MPLNRNRVSSDSFVCLIQSLPGLAAGFQHMAAVQQPAGESEHLHPQECVSHFQRSQLCLHQCDQWTPVPGLPTGHVDHAQQGLFIHLSFPLIMLILVSALQLLW